MDKFNSIYVAGHNGMVGSAIVRKLKQLGFNNIIEKKSKDLDLRDQNSVNKFFKNKKPEYVFLAAAKVGGIHANNQFRADFIYDNLMIQSNVIHAAYKNNVKKLLFLGSSCIYPKFADQPIIEGSLLTGSLELTNEPYAIAKIAGIKLCEAYRHQYGVNFISAMPTNLYGPNDNYDLQNSHVFPALIRKIYSAKKRKETKVEIWGTGTPRREFLHVDDLADASVFLMKHYNDVKIINIGTGMDISIKELAELISNILGYKGTIYYNTDYPDGTPRKLLDITKLKKLGWKHQISLKYGIKSVYKEISNNDRF